MDIRRKLFDFKLTGDVSLKDYFRSFDELINTSTSTGGKMSEEEKETYLIFRIPKEYNSVIDALKTMNDDDYDMELMKNRLFEKEVDLRRENNDLSAKVLLVEETKKGERKISQKDQKTRSHPRGQPRGRSYFLKVKEDFGN